jgi:hypothetical protein
MDVSYTSDLNLNMCIKFLSTQDMPMEIGCRSDRNSGKMCCMKGPDGDAISNVFSMCVNRKVVEDRF